MEELKEKKAKLPYYRETTKKAMYAYRLKNKEAYNEYLKNYRRVRSRAVKNKKLVLFELLEKYSIYL